MANDLAVTQTSVMVGDSALHWLRGGPVSSRHPRAAALTYEGRASSGLADPSVLGLWAFATGTWMVGVVGGGYLPAGDAISLAPTAIFITGLTQFIAGLFSFPRMNFFAATAFCSYGAYHIVNGIWFMLQHWGVVTPHNGLFLMEGYFDLSFGFISFALMIAILPANLLLTAILFTTGVGSVLLGIAQLYGGAAHVPGIARAGGAVLLVDAGIAYYLAMTIVVNASLGRELLPALGEV